MQGGGFNLYLTLSQISLLASVIKVAIRVFLMFRNTPPKPVRALLHRRVLIKLPNHIKNWGCSFFAKNLVRFRPERLV